MKVTCVFVPISTGSLYISIKAEKKNVLTKAFGQISSLRLAVLTEGSHCFPQFLQENAEIVP
jgi:hypothetical protein